jgi:hypothetical protein
MMLTNDTTGTGPRVDVTALVEQLVLHLPDPVLLNVDQACQSLLFARIVGLAIRADQPFEFVFGGL